MIEGAERNGKRLLAWISRYRLEPMIKVGRTVRRYLLGIVNAIIHRATNASAQSITAKIHKITAMACGFRTGHDSELLSCFTFVFQKYMVKGLTAGAVKG